MRSCVGSAGRTGSSAKSGRSSQKPRPGLHGRPTRSPPRIRVRDRTPGRPSRSHHVPSPGCLPQRVLRVAEATAVDAGADRWGADGAHRRDSPDVARHTRNAGVQSVSRRKPFHTTVRDETARPAPDLVDRQFTAPGPDRLWVADITYVPTWAGFLYLAVVLDAWSRRVVGWAMESHLRTELVLAALDMAVAQRRPTAVIHHSDQGCQYTSLAFGRRCGEAGVRPSMGSVGDAYDNAMCESFFATLECELLDRDRFRTQADARRAIFDFIEGWYNPRRRHSALDYLSPMIYERSRGTSDRTVPFRSTIDTRGAISIPPTERVQ